MHDVLCDNVAEDATACVASVLSKGVGAALGSSPAPSSMFEMGLCQRAGRAWPQVRQPVGTQLDACASILKEWGYCMIDIVVFIGASGIQRNMLIFLIGKFLGLASAKELAR